MTLGMLKRYFLKVGKSYYISQELKKDLFDHGKKDGFYGTSRFGIGFLSWQEKEIVPNGLVIG